MTRDADDDIDRDLVRHMRDAARHMKKLDVSPAEALQVLRQYARDQIEAPASDKASSPKAN